MANGEERFIEGLGDCSSKNMLPYRATDGKKYYVVYDETYEDIETELVE